MNSDYVCEWINYKTVQLNIDDSTSSVNSLPQEEFSHGYLDEGFDHCRAKLNRSAFWGQSDADQITIMRKN